jgi:hypothetical protein
MTAAPQQADLFQAGRTDMGPQADGSGKNKREAKGPSVVSFRLFAVMLTGEQRP